MEQDTFEVRCYHKSELAHFYFPDMESVSAVHKLMRWVKKCGELMEELEKAQYESNNQWLFTREVRLIVKHLGNP